jgi:hypothetical protein
MARGYLGKISAVVTANTGDYVRKLNDSAKTTANFARSIQSDLRQASSRVTASFKGVLTPIQQYERAIQNAASKKLKFSGFDGAIGTVQQLRRAIGQLQSEADISFVVRESGLRNISEVKKTLAGLRDSEVDLAVRVGAQGIRELLADVQEVDGKVVNVKTRIEASRLELLLGKIEKLSGGQIRALQIAVEDRQLQQAVAASDRLLSISRQIADPVARAAAEFDKLPLAVQAAAPVLRSVQDDLLRIKDLIESDKDFNFSEDDFRRLEDRATRAAGAVQQLTELQGRVNSLSTGRELAFRDPSLDAALTRAQAAGQRAAGAPADVRLAGGANISGLVEEIRRLGEQAVVLEGRLSAATDPANAAAARVEIQKLTADINAAVDLLDETIPVKVDTSAADKSLDSIIRKKKEIDDSLQFTLTGEAQNIQQAAREYDSLRGEVERFDVARRKAFDPALTAIAEIIKEEDSSRLQDVVTLLRQVGDEVENQKKLDIGAKDAADDAEKLRNAMASIADSIGEPSKPIDALRKNVDQATAAVKKLTGAQRQRAEAYLADLRTRIEANQGNSTALPSLARRAAAIRDAAVAAAPAPQATPQQNPLGAAFGSSQRQIESLRSSITSLKGDLDKLPAGVQARFVPALQKAEAEFAKLNASASATPQRIARAAAVVQKLTDTARRAAEAAKLVTFDKLAESASLEKAQGQLKAFGAILTGIGAKAGSTVVAAYEKWRIATAKAIATNTLGSAQVQKSLDALKQKAIEAAAATGKISLSTASQRVARGGDVGRAGLDKFSLAAQQAGFALDDFFSATGSIDQKLRAVANNVSQLGFVLDSTRGLFVALGVTVGAQVLIPLIRFALNAKAGEDAAKGMSAAIESQRDRVKQLADAYKELARSIAESGMSDGGRGQFSRLGERQDRIRQQRAIALDAVAGASPRLAAARGAVAATDRALGEATSIDGAQSAARASRQARAELARQERLASARVRELADSTPINQLRQQRAATRDELARERARRQNSVVPAIFTLGLSTFLPGFSTSRNRENALRERLATQQGAISLSQQRQTEDFVTRGQRIAGRFAPFQENVQGFTATGSRIDSFLSRFNDTAQQIADGTLSGRGVDKATKQLEALAANLERAAIAVQGFSQVLDSQAGQLAATVASESRSREEQLRRDANAAEAQFGQNDPRAVQARRDEQQATEARRKTERDRLKVDEQISAERERFERDLLAGRGRQADRDRADEIRRQRAIVDDETRSASDRERARLRVQRLEQEQAQSFESQPGVARLRRQADELDIQNQRAAQEIESRQRGRELALSDRERTRREIDQSAVDLRNALPDIGAGGVQEAARNLVDQLAPALAALRDEVLNARLQGPSRAALQVADINTAEGARELNRLMRGDDSARDVNLVELQKQTGVLEDIKTAIERETNVIVDL